MSDQANPSRRGGSGAWALSLLILLAYLSLLAPVFFVDTPPLLDYSNHNARLWMIAGGEKLPPLDQIYRIDWSKSATTIGIDLIAAALGPIVGKAMVGPICAGLSVFLPAFGAMLLHRRIFGGAHAWQLAIALPAFGKTVLCGFMNFNIGLGVAFLGGALDGRLVRAGPVSAFLGRLAIALLCLVVHPYAAMCYGGVILGLSLGAERGPLLRWDGIRQRLLPGVLVVAPTIVAVALIFLLAPHAPGHVGQGPTAVTWEDFSPRYVVAVLMTAFHAYSLPLDAVTVLVLIAIVAAAAWRRRLEVHAGLLLAGVAFVLVSLVMPTQIGDAYWLEFRAPTMAAFILLAAVLPNFSGVRARAGLTAVLLAVLVVRTGLVAAAWVSAQSDIRSVRSALEAVPPGSALLPLRRYASDAERRAAPLGRYFGDVAAFAGYGEMAVSQRRAFVPMLFAITGQQPIVVLGRFAPLSQPWGGQPATVEDLYEAQHPPLHRYLDHWRNDFDYILLLDATAGGPHRALPSPADVDMVADRGFAVLYRIRHEAGTKR